VPANAGRAVWEALMAAGAEFDITPYGTETMHVLRAEKGYIIVGQDTDGSVTPYDLGMGGLVAKSKDFLGKRSLSRADTSKEGRKQFVGLLTADDQLVLPEGAQIIAKDTQVSAAEPTPMIGHVTSSYYSPILKRSIALAVVKGGLNKMGESVVIPLADGKRITATISSPVFYDTEGVRQHVE
jgi:sarcosine oxidase subunit alpha